MENSKNQHVRALDGIRGVACTIVVLAHGFGLFRPDTSYSAWGTGKIGVWLFFVLSAYLLTSNFLRDGVSSGSVTRYAISRVMRIWPPFIVAVLFAFWTKTLGIATLNDAIKVLTFQIGPAHLWTISVEFKFYLVLPFIAWLLIWIAERLGRRVAMLTVVIAIFTHQIFFPYTQLKENSIEMVWYLPAFLIGCLGALITMHSKPSREQGWVGFAIGVTAITLIVISLPYITYLLFGVEPNGFIVNKYIFYGIAWCAMILCMVMYPNMLTNIFASTPLVKLGQWSYSIYLFHLFALLAAQNLLGTNVVGMLFGLVAAPIFGWVMFRLIEKPCFTIRRRLDSLALRPQIRV